MKLNELKISQQSSDIYGEEDLLDLIESITEFGLKTPLVVNENNEIISGNRRYRALVLMGQEELPDDLIIRKSSKDSMDIILYNMYRRKTNEQLIKEALIVEKHYLNKPRGNRLTMYKEIAEKTGLSPKSFIQAKKIQKKIDETDDKEEKQELINKLNKSIAAGHKAIKQKTIFNYWDEMAKGKYQLMHIYNKLATMRDGTTPIALANFIGNLKSMAERIDTWNPEKVQDCISCDGTGELEGAQCPYCISGKSGIYTDSDY